MLEPDDRDFGALIELGRLVAAVAGYDLLVPVDQNRRVEAEGGDAAGDRSDLLAAVLARTPDFNLEFAISDIDRAFCDAACEAVISWLEVFRKTSSIRNGPKLAAFPAYLGARKHLGLTLAFREVAADFLAHL